MNGTEFTITDITDTGYISGNTEAGYVTLSYDDLFSFEPGTELKRDGKVWVIVSSGLLSVHCELKKAPAYKKGFLKAMLIRDKYKEGDSLLWCRPVILSEKIA